MQKILIVDDIESNRKILSEVLKNEYEIYEAADGSEAYEMVKKSPFDFSIILLDVVMPKMDGFAFLQKTKELGITDKVPVILITSEGAPAVEIKAYNMGVWEFVEKPFNPYVVRKRVQNIVDLFFYKNRFEKKFADLEQNVLKPALDSKEKK